MRRDRTVPSLSSELLQQPQNLELVDQCILMLNTALKNGIDWRELWQEMLVAQEKGHPLAQHINALDFN